jgi:transcriptional regulator with XRE-family HTH domain
MAQKALAYDHLEFDLGDRMRKALRIADVSSIEVADYLGVSPTSVSNWLGGRAKPRRGMLRSFALRTGVPFVWLETGVAPSSDGDDGATGDVVRLEGLEPPTFCSVAERVEAAWGVAA